MATHIVSLADAEAESLITGFKLYILKFFKKRPDFFNKLKIGDLVYFKKSKGDVLGQFEIKKLVISENINIEDWVWIKEIAEGKLGVNEKEFIDNIDTNKVILIIQINKLEQFITPPIEIDKKIKKEWVVLN